MLQCLACKLVSYLKGNTHIMIQTKLTNKTRWIKVSFLIVILVLLNTNLIFQVAVHLPYSRVLELEADQVGLLLAARVSKN